MKSKEDQFDKKVAVRCAQAFAGATGIGCTVSDAAGTPLFESGYGCASCRLCAAMGQPGEQCARVHTYGMVEAERFGGQYIYFCPQGLNFFVSPILGSHGSAARITAGPFIMVDRQDFLACEVAERPGTDLQAVYPVLEHIPYVEPSRVTQLSTLLFMAVGFMNNVAAENRMLSAGRSDALQSQISNYIVQLKEAEEPPPYPFELERRLLQSISRQEKGDAQQYLNELLGAILFSAGGNLDTIKSRTAELLVLISRTAVDCGANPEQTLRLNHSYLQAMPQLRSVDELCDWLSGVVNRYMDSLFEFSEARHANLIHRCIQYIGTHYAGKITLEETARLVYLSPPYLSRIFKEETGSTFQEYVSAVRIEKAKQLILRGDLRLSDIALMVGYEDQSYFTKVFRRLVGCSPSQFRKG